MDGKNDVMRTAEANHDGAAIGPRDRQQSQTRDHGIEREGKPDTPTDIRKPTWTYVIRKTIREFMRDECTTLAAALTYYAVLSLFPAIVALVSILSLIGQAESTVAALMDLVTSVAPSGVAESVQPVIEQLTSAPAPGFGLVIGLATALWTASNYVNAFGRAMNRVYDTDEGRPIWKLRPFMYVLTAMFLVLLTIAALILVVSGPVAAWLGELIGLGEVAVTVWNIGKWPVLALIVIMIVALLYYATPNVRQPKFRWVSFGAVLAIAVAAIATVLFGIYVANFSNYNATYGALAGVIIFLLWVWIMNLSLLFGAEFDAELERGRQLQAGIPAERHLQLPPRDTRASEKKRIQDAEDVSRGEALRRSRGHRNEP